jgi:alkanesulfonate monooxygenase SsuD/methylene tetrahydromethanopterin reductase-like flavin-dependent oxidoreductase (luciferase family)
MSIERREAEFLCTGSEFQLFHESCEPWIRQFQAGSIRRSMERAAKLSDLWLSKAAADRQEARERRGKARLHSITGHVLARRKAELFSQIAQRLCDRLAVLAEIARLGHGVPSEETPIPITRSSRD